MKLITFAGRGGERAGALIDGGRKVIDLQAAHRARWKKPSRALASVLAIAEGGADALDVAAQTIKGATRAAPDAVLDRAHLRLLAPIPRPPQMRDFLCFEKHLQQAFRAVRIIRAKESPDPEAAL